MNHPVVWPEAWTAMIWKGLRWNARLSLGEEMPYPRGFWVQQLPSQDSGSVKENQ